jgi:hypothetical protein
MSVNISINWALLILLIFGIYCNYISYNLALNIFLIIIIFESIVGTLVLFFIKAPLELTIKQLKEKEGVEK